MAWCNCLHLDCGGSENAVALSDVKVYTLSPTTGSWTPSEGTPGLCRTFGNKRHPAERRGADRWRCAGSPARTAEADVAPELRASVRSPRAWPRSLGLSGGALLSSRVGLFPAGERHPAFLGGFGRTRASLRMRLPTGSVFRRSERILEGAGSGLRASNPAAGRSRQEDCALETCLWHAGGGLSPGPPCVTTRLHGCERAARWKGSW